MILKITKIRDIDGLSKALGNCRGRVELRTEEGDMLNLRSELSKLISLNVILSGTAELANVEMYIEKKVDAEIIMQYVTGEPRRSGTPHLIEIVR